MPDDLRDHYLRALHLLRDMFEQLSVEHLDQAPDPIPMHVPRDVLVAWRTRAAALPLEEAGRVWINELARASRPDQQQSATSPAPSVATPPPEALTEAWAVWLEETAAQDEEMTDGERSGFRVAATHLRTPAIRRCVLRAAAWRVVPEVGDYLTTRHELEVARAHDGVVITGTRSDIGPVLYVSKNGSWYAPGSSVPELLVCATGWTVERVPAAS